MTMKTYVLMALTLTSIAPAALAQGSNRTVEQYTCKEVMREAGSSRDAAIAFLHGFLLGKSSQSSFDLEILTKQTDAFIDQCLEHPNDKALDTMSKVKM